MEQLYEVIVIGAGISGIGASKILSENKVNHLVLESRDRFGGRIYPNKFAGITVDVGATFIHNPCENNQICKFIQEEACETV
jgi:polyamine oxidase